MSDQSTEVHSKYLGSGSDNAHLLSVNYSLCQRRYWHESKVCLTMANVTLSNTLSFQSTLSRLQVGVLSLKSTLSRLPVGVLSFQSTLSRLPVGVLSLKSTLSRLGSAFCRFTAYPSGASSHHLCRRFSSLTAAQLSTTHAAANCGQTCPQRLPGMSE